MLEVRDLDFNYHGAQILKNINFVANKGEFIGTQRFRQNHTFLINILKFGSRAVLVNDNNINGMRSRDIGKNV